MLDDGKTSSVLAARVADAKQYHTCAGRHNDLVKAIKGTKQKTE